MNALTKQEIINRLLAHRPIDPAVASRGIAVRWLATGALVMLLPMGAFLLRNRHPFLADHAWGISLSLAVVGLLGVFVGYRAATRKAAAERQWGLATLTTDECLELGEISSDIPEITAIVDQWLEAWVASRTPARGRDLALVREMVVAWRATGSGPLPRQVIAKSSRQPQSRV